MAQPGALSPAAEDPHAQQVSQKPPVSCGGGCCGAVVEDGGGCGGPVVVLHRAQREQDHKAQVEGCALREAAASQFVSRESALSPAANLVADIADGALLVDFQQGITRGVPADALQIRIDFDDLLVHVGM